MSKTIMELKRVPEINEPFRVSMFNVLCVFRFNNYNHLQMHHTDGKWVNCTSKVAVSVLEDLVEELRRYGNDNCR